MRFLTRRLRAFLLHFVVVRAATVVEVADLGTIELRFVQHRVHLIVDKACPAGGCVPRGYLRRVFLQVLLEVRGAFAAREQSAARPDALGLSENNVPGVEAGEQVDEGA